MHGGIIGVDNTPAGNKANGIWTLDEVFAHRAAGRWPRLPYNIEYLIVAGGGGAGGNGGAGGGAGGYRCSVSGELSGGGASAETPLTILPGTVLTVIIGAGGPAGLSAAGKGGNSQLGDLIADGGGGGGWGGNSASNGQAGGSGGGGAAYGGFTPRSGGAGITTQGYRGGNASVSGNFFRSAGGGGAGAIGGESPSNNVGGIGGVGVSSAINGDSITRAGGGSGYWQNTIRAESIGPNSGGGGSMQGARPGNSGVVILRYLGPQVGVGGEVTTAGGYTIHTFTTSATFTA